MDMENGTDMSDAPTTDTPPRRRFPSALGAWLRRRRRRVALAAALFAALNILLPGCLTSCLGGRFAGPPEELRERVSPEARALIDRAFAALPPGALVDYHTHLIGLGAGGTGAEVNPASLTWRHPKKRIEAGVYLNACGVKGFDDFDPEYVDRLVRLARGFDRPLKIHLLALDHYYNPDGSINRERTEFYVPNDYVVRLAAEHPDLFVPVISIHPGRPDALAELARWADRGVRHIKWLPNAQGIDPADPKHDEFYRQLAARGFVLLTHGGEEKAVEADEAQALGNPLRLRRPLDLGVTVIIAHCASMGRNEDLDHPGRQAENFDLFLRLMGEEKYRGRLFADISALTQFNRAAEHVLEALRRPDLRGRLVNGSDYPLPAVNCVIWLRTLARMGAITPEERRALKEIYGYNPLLFDFVLKRTLRDPAGGKGLPPEIFLANPALEALTSPPRAGNSSGTAPSPPPPGPAAAPGG
jgi:predicted TIM-barrel fold metal-dependent hydrolase